MQKRQSSSKSQVFFFCNFFFLVCKASKLHDKTDDKKVFLILPQSGICQARFSSDAAAATKL
jgi:hypothetical protein